MVEQWWGTYVPHTPCPLHIGLALRRHDDRLGEFVRGYQYRGEATHTCSYLVLRRIGMCDTSILVSHTPEQHDTWGKEETALMVMDLLKPAEFLLVDKLENCLHRFYPLQRFAKSEANKPTDKTSAETVLKCLPRFAAFARSPWCVCRCRPRCCQRWMVLAKRLMAGDYKIELGGDRLGDIPAFYKRACEPDRRGPGAHAVQSQARYCTEL
jgi:hypothetical protein